MAAKSLSLEDRVQRIWDTRAARGVYRLGRRLVRMLLHPYLRTEVVGAERLRRDGPFIIASVHRSNLDAPLVNSLCPRIVRSLAKREMFAGRFSTWFTAALGAFPVRRGGSDRRSLQVARQVLRRGEPLLVFPEGTRQSGSQVGEIFGGVAYLAVREKVPVLPVGVAGTEEAMPPGAKSPRRLRATVVVGEVLDPMEMLSGSSGSSGGRPWTSSAQRDQFTITLRKGMQAAMDEAVRLLGGVSQISQMEGTPRDGARG